MTEKRSLTTGMEAAIDAGSVAPILLLSAEFATGTVYFWTGFGSINWNGHTWTGLGNLVAISAIDESTEISSKGFTVSINGQSSANISLSLAACKQGAPGYVWLGCLDSSGNVVADPYLVRRARLDTAGGSDDGENSTITVSYEDVLVDLESPRQFRYTTESQAIFYPGDLGFEFVPSLQDAQDVWIP